ncbi:MAG: hypothetical protein JWQ78_1131 [Sediminibacterium sp.]|nr:hypothetical protein [Sediminibacterium sp.]
MKELTLFRILTFILLPIASLFAIMDLMMLGTALANPAFLLIVFIFAAFVIYTFSSLKFLTKGIDTGRPCAASLRDWIRVNAFVSIGMGVICLLNAVSVFLVSDVQLRQYLAQVLEKQPNVPPMLNLDLFLRIMKIAAGFMLFTSIILLAHIFLNFRVMKQYRHLFQGPVA